MRRMFDALYLPNPTPAGYDVAAGYVESVGISHPWSAWDWLRARTTCRYLLPIAGGSLYGRGVLHPESDVDAALFHAPPGYPRGVAFALDVEHDHARLAHDTGYAARWAAQMTRRGASPVIYCSATDAPLFAGLALWLAAWNRRPELLPASVATQYNAPPISPGLAVDESVVADDVPLWDTRPTPAPTPTPTPGSREEPMLVPSNHQPTPNRFVGARIDIAGRTISSVGGAGIVPNPSVIDEGMPRLRPWLGAYLLPDDADGFARFAIVTDDTDEYAFRVK